MEFVWPKDIRITGREASYEADCQKIVIAAVAWLREHKERFIPDLSGSNLFLFGDTLEEERKNRRAFEDAMDNVVPTASGSQWSIALIHAKTIFWHGWEAYVAQLKNGH